MEGNPIPSDLAVLRAKKAEVAQRLDAASDRRAKRQEEKDLILLYIKNALAAESLPIALLVVSKESAMSTNPLAFADNPQRKTTQSRLVK